MSSNSAKFLDGSAYSSQQSELLRTHAEMLASEAEANAAKRRVQLEELRSDLISPELRIRAWERVHGLRLPQDPNHNILVVIALATKLTVEQVRAVQLEDAARRRARTTP